MNNTTKNLKTICLLACLLGCLPISADRITVEHRYFGADRMEDIDAIGKWLFVDDRLQLVDHEGYLLGEEYMENIVKITFSATAPLPTSADEAQPEAIIVYPNPTQEMLCVQGVPADATLRVYSAAGQLVGSHGTRHPNHGRYSARRHLSAPSGNTCPALRERVRIASKEP